MQNRHAGRFINAAGLHPDEAVLDQIDAADAMLAAEEIELREHIDRAVLLAVDSDRLAFFECENDLLGLVSARLRAILSAEKYPPAVRPTDLQECRPRRRYASDSGPSNTAFRPSP